MCMQDPKLIHRMGWDRVTIYATNYEYMSKFNCYRKENLLVCNQSGRTSTKRNGATLIIFRSVNKKLYDNGLGDFRRSWRCDDDEECVRLV